MLYTFLPSDIAKICFVAVLFVCLRGLFWFINMLLIQPIFDPLRFVPGPDGTLLQSHLQQVMDPTLSTNTYLEWKRRFGRTFRFNGFGKHDYRLISFDPRVIQWVLGSSAFEKPWQTRSFMSRLIGRGIFSMEGKEHTQQRKIVHSAFTPRSVKNMTPIFFRKAEELRERWKNILEESQYANSLSKSKSENALSRPCRTVLDVAHWTSRAAFDVIGLAGFNYDFHSIQNESEPVYSAYRRMFNIADKGLGLRQIMELYFPILRTIWPNEDIKETNQCLKIIKTAGEHILTERKTAVQISEEDGENDLLSLLIKSNMLSKPSERLTDQELLDQCSTFFMAGSDSVAVALSWCFHLLSLNPDIQKRLRAEIKSISHISEGDISDYDSENHDCEICKPESPFQQIQSIYPRRCRSLPQWEAVENLPYLNSVVLETLRFCPPVHGTIRVATQTHPIPISRPISLFDGSAIASGVITDFRDDYLTIKKGSYVHVPIEGWNLSEDVWGPDSLVFNPSRWSKPSYSNYRLGPNNLLTFGYGHQSCLGYKFTVAEMKIFLAILLPAFEFKPADGVPVSKFNTILTRPFVSGKWAEGTQLPILVNEIK
ncbi:Cytochrome P450 monooxygenase 197 [Psilocybe cubensis]|uniref:Cytochrome P450 n=2 Tax=Psilocybe cubensis TaxID=181762 RepID=A0A8H7Y7X8_PSICU|nr:Cytochrome P450 monooxygenase 197 [Psilocybe cubensis]KAH9486659.1 Cytochrome P450 monooxygenase 197 [Psilocybe cubensis]